MTDSSRRVHYWRLFLILLFGFFLLFRPFEDFLTEYVVKDRGFSMSTLVRVIFPVWTYSTPITQFLAGITSELPLFGKKWTLFFGVVSSALATLCILSTGFFTSVTPTFALLFVSEVFFSLYFSSHVAFFGIRYTILPHDWKHVVTGLSRSCMLLGYVIAGLIGQAVYSFVSDRFIAFVILLGCNVIMSLCGVLVSMLFPGPSDGVHSDSENSDQTINGIRDEHSERQSCFRVCWIEVKEVLMTFLSNYRVSFWSTAVILSAASRNLVRTYAQPLYKQIDWKDNYNGVANAVSSICSAIVTAIFPWLLKGVLRKYEEVLIIFMVPLQGALLMVLPLLVSSSSGTVLWGLSSLTVTPFLRLMIAYVVVCIYVTLNEFFQTCSYAQIATHLRHQKFSSVFAINAVVQVPIQIILQAVTDDPGTIFRLLGAISVVSGLVLLGWFCGRRVVCCCRRRQRRVRRGDRLADNERIGIQNAE